MKNKQITTNLPPDVMREFRIKCAASDTNPTRKLAQLATAWTLASKKKPAKKAKWASDGNAIGEGTK